MTPPPSHSEFHSVRTGFSLVEMVVSLAVISVLTVGMSSAVVLATRVLPHQTNPAAASLEASAALQQLRDDLRCATHLHQRQAHSVTLNLPDRNADGRPEVITWAWSGTPGDPLTRTVAGQSARTVLAEVQDFDLTFNLTDVATVYPGAVSRSDEVLLSSFDDPDSGDEYQIEDEKEIGFRFTPALPAGAESWKLSRVLLRTDNEGKKNGTAEVRFAAAAGNQPGATLAAVEIDEEDVLDENFDWAEIEFAGVPELAAGQTATITVADIGKGKAGRILWDANGTPANVHYRDSATTSYTTPSPEGAVNHYVYGTYPITGDDWTLMQPCLASVTVHLTHPRAAHLQQTLTISLPNRPVAAAHYLEADLAVDPSTLDLDADGLADWELENDTHADEFVDGGWQMQTELFQEQLGEALNQTFILELWLQDTTDDNDGGELELRFDRSGGIGSNVKLHLVRDGPTQDLSLEYHNADHEDVILHTARFPAGQTVAVKLTVDPERDVLALSLDGQAPLSFAYGPDHDNKANKFMLKPKGVEDGLRLEHIRLTVAGQTTSTPGAYVSGGNP